MMTGVGTQEQQAWEQNAADDHRRGDKSEQKLAYPEDCDAGNKIGVA